MKDTKSWLNIFNKSSAFKREGGFTVVEMLVVISIITLLSSLALSYNRASERQIRLFRDQSTIVTILNRAKSLSLQRFNEQSGGISICAVGVRFPDSKNYHLFQDTIDPESENCNDDANYRHDSGEDIESFSLGDQIEFHGDASEGLEILFIPPHLGVTSTVAFPADIEVRTIDLNNSTSISVSGAGQITIQEIGSESPNLDDGGGGDGDGDLDTGGGDGSGPIVL